MRARPQNLNSNYIIIYIKYRLAPTNTAANPKLISVLRAAPVYGWVNTLVCAGVLVGAPVPVATTVVFERP